MSNEVTTQPSGTRPSMRDTKFCPHCESERPVEAFARRRRDSNARQAWCRDCINVTRREAYARAKGIDHATA